VRSRTLPIALATLVALAACERPGTPGGLTLDEALRADWNALEVALVTRMADDRKGGAAIVFLHGYGTPPSRYADLARAIADADTRVFLPTAVLPHASSEHPMWWEFIDEDWPRPYSEDPGANAWPKPSKQLPRAREAVLHLVARIRDRYQPETLVVAGHSQGAMLALDVALAAEPPPDRVVLLSGYLLLDSAANLAKPRDVGPPILISHGREDAMVGLDRAERMRRVLEQHGFPVTFAPHDGDHRVDEATIRRLREFLSASARAARR
jgi:phospholipase/carboxylesterase